MSIVRMHIDEAEALAAAYDSAAVEVRGAVASLSPLVTQALALLDQPGQNPVYGPMPALTTAANGLADDQLDVAWRIDLLRANDAIRLDAIRLSELSAAIDNWSGTDNDPILDRLLRERRELIEKYVESGELIPPTIALQLLAHLTAAEVIALEQQNPATFDIAYLNAVIAEHDASAFPDDPINAEIEHLRDLRDGLVADYAGGVDGRPDTTIAAIAQRNGISYEQAQLAVEVNAIDRLNDQMLGVPSALVASETRAERDDLILDFLDGDTVLAGAVGRLMNQGHSLGDALSLVSPQHAVDGEEDDGYFHDIPGGFQVTDVAAGLRDGVIDGIEGIGDLAGGIWNFATTALTDPGQIDDMVMEQVDTVTEVVTLISDEIRAGNWDTVVVEFLLPMLGIEEQMISERGLDYGIGYAIAANPEILVAGGGLMVKLVDGISELRASGRIGLPDNNRLASASTGTPNVDVDLVGARIGELDIDNLDFDLSTIGSELDGQGALRGSGQDSFESRSNQPNSETLLGDELNAHHNEVRQAEPYWGAADNPRIQTDDQLTSPEQWISDINGEGNHLPGRNNNCLDCTRAVEVRWRGGNGTAAPLVDVNAEGLSAWEPILENLQNGRVMRTSENGISQQLAELGDGSSAQIVVRWKGRMSGHAFNAVNDGGVVRWVDGQEGQVSGWPPPYAEHATDWQAIIVDPAGNPVGG